MNSTSRRERPAPRPYHERPASERVVITGIGLISSIGATAPETWAALQKGQSGIAPITFFDPSALPSQIAGEVKDLDRIVEATIDPREARHMDRFAKLAMVAASEAVADAHLVIDAENADDTGVVIGTCFGGYGIVLEQQATLLARGARRVSPFAIPNMMPDAATGQVAIATGARGVNMAVASACATGGHSVGEAAEMIRRGDASTMLAGASDAVILPLIIAAFASMKTLSTQNDPPTKISRPFDRDRSGFVLAEAGAMMVLESLEQARDRGARIYAEIAGYGATNDAYHMTTPANEGEGIGRAMRVALRRAGLCADQVDYINAHGTSTQYNDRTETEAIKAVFGDHAYKLAISSTKSMTGHPMGAAGVLEAIVCALVIRDGIIPPTINYETPDPACDLDYVPNVARHAPVRVALSNAIGMGGHNASLILSAV